MAFTAVRRHPGPVVVVDDVCTTGATARAAAVALEGAVHGPIRFLTAARTP